MTEQGESFFSSLTGLDAAEALARCEQRFKDWRADVVALQTRLGNLPRNDKATAHEIKAEAARIEAKLRRLKPVIATYRGEAGRIEAHGLWCDAVREICGPDKVRECFDWMKAERRARRIRLEEADSVRGA